MNVVAEKTGYPSDMLELGMDMEADLGIDSIKRVEILGAVQDEIPNLPELNPEDLAELRTLGQIVDYMQEKAGAAASVASAVPQAAVATSSVDVAKIQSVLSAFLDSSVLYVRLANVDKATARLPWAVDHRGLFRQSQQPVF